MAVKKNTTPKVNVISSALDWFRKIERIKNEIKDLEKVSNVTTIYISVFLLKSQLIEFELKQLINTLDQHLYFTSGSTILKIRVKTPLFLSKQKQTMGDLIQELERYDGVLLNDIKVRLQLLKKTRNQFTHNLFGPGSLNRLIEEAETGIQLANMILGELEKINYELHRNDPLEHFSP